MTSQAGGLAWHELRVPDLNEGARFYGGLFGWSFEDNPMGRTIKLGDVVIGGASAVKAGLDNHWTPYITCGDVDAVAAAATAAGGIVTSGRPADVPGIGRIAPILDTQKTIFAAFTPVPGSRAAANRQAPGQFVWARLRTPDPGESARFYAAALGWRPTLGPRGDDGVFELADGTRVAEMVRPAPDTPAGWLGFVLVDRLADARDRAVELGGAVVTDETEVPGTGRFATITDSQGASIALYEAASH